MTTPLSRQDLLRYFSEGSKKRSDFQVGVEWEKIGVYRDTGKAIPYSGDRGVAAIFKNLIDKHGWEPSTSHPPVIALKKGNGSITLEPGGQIELSGQKAYCL